MRQNSQLIGGKGDVRKSSLKQVQPVEIRNEGADSISRLMEEHNNWLAPDNLRLSERYFNGEMHLVLHVRFGDTGEYVACFQVEGGGRRLLQEGGICDFGRDGKDAQEISRDVPYLAWGHAVQDILRTNREQQAVLVNVVKAVELPENFSGRSSVCFDRRQRFYSVMPQALFNSPKSGFKFLGALSDREVNLLSGVCRGRAKGDQVVGQMVKSAPEVMDGVSGDKGNVGWDRSSTDEFINALASVRIVLGLEWICASTDKSVPRHLEIEDVFFGPF